SRSGLRIKLDRVGAPPAEKPGFRCGKYILASNHLAAQWRPASLSSTQRQNQSLVGLYQRIAPFRWGGFPPTGSGELACLQTRQDRMKCGCRDRYTIHRLRSHGREFANQEAESPWWF